MLTINLHIGRGKTGSTAIQRWLAANRDILLRHGVSYLLTDDRGRGSGHQQFAKSFIANPPRFMTLPKQPEEIRRQVHAEITESPVDQIIVSSENLPLADVSDVAAFFDRLPIAHRTRIIFFARSQDELAESEYNQMVKLKRVSVSFMDYAEHRLEGCHFDTEMAPWERHFGHENLVCRIYDASRQDVVSQFLAAISEELPRLCEDELQNSQKSTNSAIGFGALSIIRRLNATEIADRQSVYTSVVERFANTDLPALFLTSKTAKQFRSRYADSNCAFTERYLGKPFSDLGGRRYSDRQRDDIIEQLRSQSYLPGSVGGVDGRDFPVTGRE